MEEELQLQNFNEHEWENYKPYYYRHEETDRTIHEETYQKKAQRAYIWGQAIEYATEQIEELAAEWRVHGNPVSDACADQIEELLRDL